MALFSLIIGAALAIGKAATAIATAIGIGTATSVAIGVAATYATIGGIIYGGYAVSKALSTFGRSDPISNSPTLGSNVLQTQSNNKLPIPLLYGEFKLAGNRIWQNENGNPLKRLVAFAEGEIEGFSDIRLNDLPIADIKGATYTAYKGTSSQTISTLIPGTSNKERAELVGGLKNLAYLALSVPQSDKINGSYNLTAVVKGRKVRIYTNENTYTTAYSNNPAWCLLDFLTAYNGAGVGVKNDGTRDDAEIKRYIDIDSFIEAAAYCDETINYYQYTTNLTGENNDLIWKGRKAGDQGITITYVNPALASQAASIEIDVDNNITVNLGTDSGGVITTTAGDIISLVNNNADVLSQVRVYNADNNTGSGLVTGLTQTSLTAGTGSKRFTFNMIFDSEFTVMDVIEEFKKNCRGALVTKGDKLQFKIDKAGSPVKVFTKDDIIKNSENFYTIPKNEHYDIIKVEYIDPNYEWSKVQAQSELADYQNEPAIVHNVNIYSITNFEQAARLAWYYLNSKRLCPNFGDFKTDYKAQDLEIGDIITIDVELMNLTGYNVKVIKVIDDASGVFQVFWRSYDENLYTDELGSIDPTVLYSVINNYYIDLDDVQFFQTSLKLNTLQFNWIEIPDRTFNIFYEIRKGASWDNSTLIASNLYGSSYSMPLKETGEIKYWIKAKNKYGAFSTNAKMFSLNISSIPNYNVISVNDLLSDMAGTFSDTYFINNQLSILPVYEWTSTGTWDNLGQYYAPYGYWQTITETSGYYESQIFDIGEILTSGVSVNYDVYSLSSNSSIQIEWKISDDNITWSDWIPFLAADYTFRYYQFKITMNSPDASILRLIQFTVYIDVPDLMQDESIVLMAGVNTITFPNAFNIIPTMAVTIYDAQQGDYYNITNLSKTGFNVVVKNASNIPIVKNIHYYAKAY